MAEGEMETAAASPRGVNWPSVAEVVLCSGYPSQLAIGAVLQAAGIAPMQADGTLSATFIFALSLVDTVVVLTLITWLLARRGERPWAVFTGGLPVGREAVAGVLSLPIVVTVVVAVSVAIRLLAPGLHNVPENPLEGLLGTQTGLLAFLFVVIVAGGVREELQRAFLLHRFRHDLGGPVVGLVITSVAFGLGHTLQGWDAAIITGLLGAMWGAMYIARGGAVAGMVSHSLFNSSQLVNVFFNR